MKTQRIIRDGVRSYATVANAEKAIEKALGKMKHLSGMDDVRYLVGVAPDGRYVPVVVPNSNQLIYARTFADLGIMVVG